jgi:UDPglucose--hexose-1-phosphate uridylyltransferase
VLSDGRANDGAVEGTFLELRQDPLLNEWVIVSGQRKNRPSASEKSCPFCPGGREIPKGAWKVLSLQNLFPSLTLNPPRPDLQDDDLYRCGPAKGSCEVILYTPQHDSSLANLEVDHIRSVIELWTERFKGLGENSHVKYVFIFENKGRETGTTLDHPHGQIYAFPFIPPRIKTELSSSKRYWLRNRTCLFCNIMKREKTQALRVVCENERFLCFLPFFAHWPYGVHVYPKRHLQALTDLTGEEKEEFARILKDILTRFDHLFNMSFPYMMVLHQRPTDRVRYPHYHFHVEFYPPLREKDKVKYFGSVENGAGTTTFDYSPEEKAKELRESIPTTKRT